MTKDTPSTENAMGLTFNATFTPAAGDLNSPTAAVNVIEIGGDANGSGLYLLGGELHFISKMNGNGNNTVNLGALNDLAFNSGNNMIGAKSSFGSLTAGTEYSVAVIFDPITSATLQIGVKPTGSGLTVDNFSITGVGTKTNWSGDDSATAFRGNPPNNVANLGGAVISSSSNTSYPFHENNINANPFEGTQGQGLYWSLNGALIIPELTVNTDPLAFGNVRVGTSQTLSAEIENTGDDGMVGEFGATSGSPFTPATSAAYPSTLAGGTRSRDYGFTPTARGPASDSVDHTNTALVPTEIASMDLTGTGVGPELFLTTFDTNGTSGPTQASPDSDGNAIVGAGPHGSADFPGLDLINGPTMSQVTLRLTNMTPDGDQGALTDLTILGFSLSGPDPDDVDQFTLLTEFAGLSAADKLLEADGSDFLDIIVKVSADFDLIGAQFTAFLDVMTDQGAALGQPGADFSFQLNAVQIPEPASILISSLALLGMGLLGWRRRKRA